MARASVQLEMEKCSIFGARLWGQTGLAVSWVWIGGCSFTKCSDFPLNVYDVIRRETSNLRKGPLVASYSVENPRNRNTS